MDGPYKMKLVFPPKKCLSWLLHHATSLLLNPEAAVGRGLRNGRRKEKEKGRRSREKKAKPTLLLLLLLRARKFWCKSENTARSYTKIHIACSRSKKPFFFSWVCVA